MKSCEISLTSVLVRLQKEFLIDDSDLSVELILAVLLRGLPLPPLVEAAAGLTPPQLGEVARHDQLTGALSLDCYI